MRMYNKEELKAMSNDELLHKYATTYLKYCEEGSYHYDEFEPNMKIDNSLISNSKKGDLGSLIFSGSLSIAILMVAVSFVVWLL